jgi:diguanylate cyclase (GGDEF)-like protein
MMDLDHFKRVNDRFGHAAGDDVLRAFVDRVRAEVRKNDILIRRGGEEFLLLMPSTTTQKAAKVAERIRDRVAKKAIEVGGSVDLTVTIGVATWRKDESPDSLAARADSALYRGKENGRNCVTIAD